MSRCLSRVLAIAVLPVLLIGLAACGKGSSGGGETSGGVKGGPGVTAKTITLGVQTDLSRRVRRARRGHHPEQPALLEGPEREGRDLRPPGQADRQGPRLRPADGRDPVPRHLAQRRRAAAGDRLADLRGAAAELEARQHARAARRLAADAAGREARRHHRRQLRRRGDQRHRLDDEEQGPEEGRQDRRPLLRGRLRRGRPGRRQVRRAEGGPAGRRAEDQGHRHRHVRPGRRVQARRREGDVDDGRAQAAGVRRRRREGAPGSTCRSAATARCSRRRCWAPRSVRRSRRT